MPTNFYGPHDNYHPENSHVIPALLRRFHEAVQQGAREVVIWGSGRLVARVVNAAWALDSKNPESSTRL